MSTQTNTCSPTNDSNKMYITSKMCWQSFTLQEIFDRTPVASEDLVEPVPELDHPHSTLPHLEIFGRAAWQ